MTKLKTLNEAYFESLREAEAFLGFGLDESLDYEEEPGKHDNTSISYFVLAEGYDDVGYTVSYDQSYSWGSANFYVSGPYRRELVPVTEYKPKYFAVQKGE